MTCFTEKLLKTTLKNIKVSGNGPKNKQQVKKHLFKKIYKNLVRKVNEEHSLLLFSQLSEADFMPDCCSQQDRDLSPPHSQLEGFLPRRKRTSAFLSYF